MSMRHAGICVFSGKSVRQGAGWGGGVLVVDLGTGFPSILAAEANGLRGEGPRCRRRRA